MGQNKNTTRSKVARVIDEYDLDGLGDELEERWTRSEDRSSLRALAEYFNRQVLREHIEMEGTDPLDGEIENLYRLLTDEDVTSGVRHETRSRLERRGVDIDPLESDFVSYQAIRTYLRSCRDVSPPEESDSPEDRREQKRNAVQQLSGRLKTVARDALTELRNAGYLTLGQFDVLVTVQVHCSDCDAHMSVSDLLKQGGCQCEGSNH